MSGFKKVLDIDWTNLTFFCVLLLLISLPLQTSACKSSSSLTLPDIVGDTVDADISDWLESDAELSLFTNALKKADLLSAIDSADCFLVFAPTNFVLREEGSVFLLEEIISADEIRDKLLTSLKLHIVKVSTTSLDFNDNAFFSNSMQTLSGHSLLLRRLSSRVFVGRNTLVTKMIHTVNGTVFYIDGLLLAKVDSGDKVI